MAGPPDHPSSAFRRIVAAVLVVAGLGVSGCGARTGTTTAVADAQIAVRVKTALVNDAALGTLPLDVEVRAGVVTLRGIVRSADERDRAVGLARDVAGVTRVDPALEIGEPEPVDRVPEEARLPALAPPRDGAPFRLIGIGVSLGTARPTNDDLGDAVALGPLVRLRPRDGLGPTVGFSWTETAIERGIGGSPLASMRLRPVMAGVEYGIVRGRLAAGASIVAGYAFNSLEVDTQLPGPDRAIAIGNSVAWRPGVSVWYDLSPRIGLNVFAGYLGTRPRVTFASDAAITTRRVTADSAVFSVGAAYWIF